MAEEDELALMVDVPLLEVVELGMIGLIMKLMFELVLVNSEVDQFPVQVPVQVELGLTEELAAEVIEVVFDGAIGEAMEDSDEEVVVGDDGVVLDVGVGEAVGDPESSLHTPVHEPFQAPVNGPVHAGLDVFIAEMTLMMFDVMFCTTVIVVTSPSTVLIAVVVVAW